MLEKEEIVELKKYVDKYRDIHARVSAMEQLIANLDNEKNDLLSELEYTRQQEVQFSLKLLEKHGSDIMNSKELKDAITSNIRS